MSEFGKLFILIGGLLVVVGLVLVVAGRFHLPLGRLPGDISYHGKHTVVYFPLATSLLISILLSLILFLIGRFRR